MSRDQQDNLQTPDESQIADLINMLDSFMEDGGGHMNIIRQDGELVEEAVVETFRTLDCSRGNMACAVPTLHKGFDDEDDSCENNAYCGNVYDKDNLDEDELDEEELDEEELDE